MTQQSLVPELPEPLVPADCNLRDFPEYRLDVDRLRRSKAWLMAKRSPAIGFYQLNLWCAAWHELPAGSIENDADVLADRALCSPEQWPAVRDEALRGWLLCRDGRLYHPTVCEKALEGWIEKLNQRRKSGAGNAAKWGTPFDPVALTEAIRDCFARLERLRPQSKLLERRAALEAVPVIKQPVDNAGKSRVDPLGIQQGSLGKGRVGKGRDIERGAKAPLAAPAAPPPAATKQPAGASFVLPDWVPQQAWADFESVRMRMGKSIPFTDAARAGIVRKLDKLRAEGHDVVEMLEQSTRNGWRDVFPVKGGSARVSSGSLSNVGQRTAENVAAAERRLFPNGDLHAAS